MISFFVPYMPCSRLQRLRLLRLLWVILSGFATSSHVFAFRFAGFASSAPGHRLRLVFGGFATSNSPSGHRRWLRHLLPKIGGFATSCLPSVFGFAFDSRSSSSTPVASPPTSHPPTLWCSASPRHINSPVASPLPSWRGAPPPYSPSAHTPHLYSTTVASPLQKARLRRAT